MVRSRRFLLPLLALAILPLAACATNTSSIPNKTANPIEGAVAQPFKDLSFVRDEMPEALSSAAATPYAADNLPDCPAIMGAIAQLDAVLGADVDAEVMDANGGEAFLSDALRGALSLPFRGVIRQVSGAAKRDREKARAVLAGMVRRGFLKGLGRAKGCPAPETSPR